MSVIRELITKWVFQVDHSPLHKVEKELEGIKERLEILAAAEVLHGIFELAEHFGDFAEQLHLSAESAGLTVEAFQKLAFSAKATGISEEEMSSAMARLTKNLYEARQGSAEAQKKFSAVGFTQGQIAGFKTGQDVLLAFADRIKATEDPIKRQALTLELMGRGAKNMVGYLAQGSAGIRGLGNEAEELGIILSHDQVEALQEVEHALQKFFAIIKAIGATLASYFAPEVKAAVEEIMNFYKANKDVIQTNMKQWVGDIAYIMGILWGIVKHVAEAFFSFAKAFPTLTRYISEFIFLMGGFAVASWLGIKVLNIMKGAIEVLATAFETMSGVGKAAMWPIIKVLELARFAVSQLIMRLGVLLAETFPALSAAIFEFGAALAATPIGLIAAGIAALALAGQALWTIFSGGNWEDTWIYKLYSTIKDLLTSVPKFVDHILDLKEGATSGLFGKVADFFTGGPENQGNAANAAQNFDYIQQAQNGIPNSIASTPASQVNSDNNYSVNAPININIAGHADPAVMGKHVQAGVKEHLDRVFRETKRSTASPLRY